MAPSAHWTAKEELAFVDFLVDHKAEAGDGANFKAATFQKAAQHIVHLLERGAAKNAKSCGNKYCAFRKLYRVIRAIQAVSGWSWDDETGATIDVHTASSWDDYVRVHPEAKPFRNKGWPYFRKMEMLMPSTVAGANVYHAATAPPPMASQPPATTSSSTNSDDGSDGEGQPNEVSDDEEITPPPSSGTKRRREPATPTKPTVKRARASNGASALMSMAESLGNFNATFADALAPPSTGIPPTPVRRTKAIATILHLEKGWLTTTQRAVLVDFIKSDQTAADVYLALTEEDVRREWVRIQLNKLGVTVAHP